MIVNLFDMPEPKLPSWAKSWALDGIAEPLEIDISRTTKNVAHCDSLKFPTGREFFEKLVPTYDSLTDWSGIVYRVSDGDPMMNHCGLKVVEWQRNNWHTLEADFQERSKGKCFFGWGGTVRDRSGFLRVPYNYIDPNTGPRTLWYLLAVRTLNYFHYMTYR